MLLPVCEPEITLSWVYWTPASAFVRSRYAPIQEPVGERFGPEVMRSAVGVFLPATAVDLSGNRIGQGGGYYDKFLATLEPFPGRPDRPTATHRFRRSPQPPSSMTARSCPPAASPRSPLTAGFASALTPGGWSACSDADGPGMIELALRPCDC